MKRLLIALVLITIICAGCGTARQNFYRGQGLDVVTTGYGLEIKDDYEEANPLCDNYEQVLILKAVSRQD